MAPFNNVVNLTVEVSGPKPRRVSLSGRVGWELARLIEAGRHGCTPLRQPAPRWSAYIHLLRTKHRIEVVTLHRTHGGPYPGHHGVYALKSRLRVISVNGRKA